MTETATTADAAHAAMAATKHDDRLAYRGVFQRIFTQPEIGAAIGAVAIWIFFWATSVQFGTAGGAQNILDIAATLGIMAVAVSMLMIGGEFDLSSGANTGAMAMLVIYLVKPTGALGGMGLPIWLALIISFAVALGIGWLNGFMVDRTKLPSFIVTLATFFVLKGLKLGLAKRFVGKIEVGSMKEGRGYSTWSQVFASEWHRNAHIWGARDAVYTFLCLCGIGLVAIAIYELHFKHRAHPNTAGVGVFILGLVGIVSGILVLHRTDSIPMNWVGAIVIAVGSIVTAIGLGVWRYEPLAWRGTVKFTGAIINPLLVGLALVLASFVALTQIDSADTGNLVFPFTVQGFRALLFGGFASLGFVELFIAASRAKRVSMVTKALVSMIIAGVLVASAFVVQYESTSYKFRVEAFSFILAVALLVATWAIAGLFFAERTVADRAIERPAMIVGVLGVLMFVAGIVIKTLFITKAQLATANPALFSIRIVWFVGFTAIAAWVLGQARFGNWTFAVGGNAKAARETGVPAARTKTRLFMLVSGAAWLVGVLLAFRISTVQANTGDGQEFEYIIAAVVGGTLLTGGYGSAIGGAIGALVMAMATLGIPNARWNSDWRFLFLGGILLLAVIANRYIRTKAEAMK